jgi:hypothetical protein
MAKNNETPKGFTCECGESHAFGVYVFAHWDEALTHTCDCGRKHVIRSGLATLIKEAKNLRSRKR